MFYLRKDSIINNFKKYQANIYRNCNKAVTKAKYKSNVYYLNKQAFTKATAKSFDYAILEKTKKNDLKRIIEFENIKIDLNKKLIFKNKIEFKINNTEKIILEKMINNPGKTFERMEIGKLIDLDKERSIDVIITRLRKKIELDPKNPKFLQTIRGAGYVLWIE